MLSQEGIQKLIEAQEQIFATKQEFEELRKDFSRLANGVDNDAKKADTYFQEMVMLAHKVDRHEKWIQQLATKLGLKLEY